MKLEPRAVLRVGLQIVGVLTIIESLGRILGTVLVLTDGSQPMPALLLLGSIIIPIIILIAGIFLLIAPRALLDKLYTNEKDTIDSARTVFDLAMKITGMVMIVKALPDASQILSNIIYIKFISPAISTHVQSQFIYDHLISMLLSLIIGYYLLKGGPILERLAFRDYNQQS